MGNADINEYVRNNTGSFRPLDGHKPSDGQQAESIFVRDTEKYFYLAVFNYSTTAAKSGKVSFERMGVDPESIESIKELWMNETVTYDNSTLSYSVPAKDVRVFRIAKDTNTGISIVEDDDTRISIKSDGENMNISAEKGIDSVAIYSPAGTLLSKSFGNGENEITLPRPTGCNVYIIKTLFADGSVEITKYK
jgi:alpha-galactosidase